MEGAGRLRPDFAADPRPEATLGIVSGRRRQGKTYLLRSLAAATGDFFFEAAEATESESLRMFGAALARQAGSPADFSFPGWEDALRYFVTLAGQDPVPLIIDEFPYLVKASPALPSLLRREIDRHGPSQGSGSRARMLLCGSAMPVMGGLLAGNAPLRGRAGLEMVIKPFGYRDAARFWGVSDPGLAARLHAIAGGTPASVGSSSVMMPRLARTTSTTGSCARCSTPIARCFAKRGTSSPRRPISGIRRSTTRCWRR